MKTATEETMLVIGFGNPLRQDDCAGVKVAERVQKMGLPGVRVRACRQLLPELADEIAQAQAVVFVDAEADPAGHVSLSRLAEAESGRIDSHVSGPSKLLALTRELFGEAPPAWLLTVPARRFGFGNEVTATAMRGIEEAVEEVRRLAELWYY